MASGSSPESSPSKGFLRVGDPWFFDPKSAQPNLPPAKLLVLNEVYQDGVRHVRLQIQEWVEHSFRFGQQIASLMLLRQDELELLSACLFSCFLDLSRTWSPPLELQELSRILSFIPASEGDVEALLGLYLEAIRIHLPAEYRTRSVHESLNWLLAKLRHALCDLLCGEKVKKLDVSSAIEEFHIDIASIRKIVNSWNEYDEISEFLRDQDVESFLQHLKALIKLVLPNLSNLTSKCTDISAIMKQMMVLPSEKCVDLMVQLIGKIVESRLNLGQEQRTRVRRHLRWLANRTFGAHRRIYQEAKLFIRMLRDEVGMAEVEALDRLQGIKKEIANTGTYSIQAPELAFGAKLAWRCSMPNFNVCEWRGINVCDLRYINSPREIFDQLCAMLDLSNPAKATSRSSIIIFPASIGRSGTSLRFLNSSLYSFAGYYEESSDLQIGDPSNLELTRLLERVFSSPLCSSDFDLLPIVLQVHQDSRLATANFDFAVPHPDSMMVSISHPKHSWLEKLNIRWPCLNVQLNHSLILGGLTFPATACSSWFTDIDVVDRLLTFPNVYKRIESKLSSSQQGSVSQQQVFQLMVEAVRYSFRKKSVRLEEVTSVQRMFEEHCAKEVQQKRGLVLRSQCVPTEEGFYYFKIDPDLCRLPRGSAFLRRRCHFYNFPLDRIRSASSPGGEQSMFSWSDIDILVLFGSEIGVAEEYAIAVASCLQMVFSNVRLCTLDAGDVGQLSGSSILVIITSTFPNGEAPFTARKFHHLLTNQRQRRSWTNLSFAVFGVGKTAPSPCADYATVVDKLLAEGGAKRLMPCSISSHPILHPAQRTELRKWTEWTAVHISRALDVNYQPPFPQQPFLYHQWRGRNVEVLIHEKEERSETKHRKRSRSKSKTRMKLTHVQNPLFHGREDSAKGNAGSKGTPNQRRKAREEAKLEQLAALEVTVVHNPLYQQTARLNALFPYPSRRSEDAARQPRSSLPSIFPSSDDLTSPRPVPKDWVEVRNPLFGNVELNSRLRRHSVSATTVEDKGKLVKGPSVIHRTKKELAKAASAGKVKIHLKDKRERDSGRDEPSKSVNNPLYRANMTKASAIPMVKSTSPDKTVSKAVDSLPANGVAKADDLPSDVDRDILVLRGVREARTDQYTATIGERKRPARPTAAAVFGDRESSFEMDLDTACLRSIRDSNTARRRECTDREERTAGYSGEGGFDPLTPSRSLEDVVSADESPEKNASSVSRSLSSGHATSTILPKGGNVPAMMGAERTKTKKRSSAPFGDLTPRTERLIDDPAVFSRNALAFLQIPHCTEPGTRASTNSFSDADESDTELSRARSPRRQPADEHMMMSPRVEELHDGHQSTASLQYRCSKRLKVLRNELLSISEDGVETRRIVLDGSLSYDAGDLLGIMLKSTDEDIESVIKVLPPFHGEVIQLAQKSFGRIYAPPPFKAGSTKRLLRQLDFSLPVYREVLSLLFQNTTNENGQLQLRNLMKCKDDELSAFTEKIVHDCPTLIHLAAKYTPLSLTVDELLQCVCLQRPRVYSIMSSPLTSREISILVNRRTSLDRGCAAMLAKAVPGTQLRCFVRPTDFHVPLARTSATIFVCTGIAISQVYSLLSQRFADESPTSGPLGRTLLFYGTRYLESAPLLTELKEIAANGGISKLILGVSREKHLQFMKQRQYIQDKIWEHRNLVLSMISAGARIYYAGDSRVWTECRKVFIKVLMQEGDASLEEATEHFSILEERDRVKLSLWGHWFTRPSVKQNTPMSGNVSLAPDASEPVVKVL